MSKPKSLWLNPSRKPVKVDLRERFAWYPYFIWKMDVEYPNQSIPKTVEVIWVPLDDQELLVDAGNDGEAAEANEWIDTVAAMMEAGRDIPPIFLHDGILSDGNHRGLAATSLGIRLAPAVEIGSYWKS